MLAALVLVELWLLLVVALVLPFTGIHGWSTNRHRSPGLLSYETPAVETSRTYQSRNNLNRNFPTYLQLSTAIDQSTTDDDIIQILHEPDSTFISSKGVLDWPTWSCPVSKFPWSYSETEVCYLIKGKVIITPVINNNNNEPSASPKSATIAAGDYVTLSAGLSCTWDVIEAVEKHYMFI